MGIEKLNYIKTTNMKTSKVLWAIAGATATGVVLGMLLAPEKGAELRKRVRTMSKGWLDRATDLIASVQRVGLDANRAAEEEVKRIQSNLEPLEH